MLAYISYSLNKEELPIITALSNLLKGRFQIEVTSNSDFDKVADFKSYSTLKSASLFIGITTIGSNKGNQVTELFQVAQKNNTPSFLFEEVESAEQVQITSDNVIRFYRPQTGNILQLIEKKIREVYANLNDGEPLFIDKNELAWLVSGTTATNMVKWFGKLSLPPH